jgi:hypothetical protein
MFDELLSIIIQAMGENRKPMSISDLEEACGYDKSDLFSPLNTLKNIGLIKISEKANNMYELVVNLKGLHIARAAQAGVDVSSLDGYFKIDKKEKKVALEIANNGEKARGLDVKARKPLLHKRAYMEIGKTDDTYDNLILLLEGASTSLYEHLEELAKKDAYLKLLLNMHQQAENSLHNYLNGLK